jgi:hypothetical protein
MLEQPVNLRFVIRQRFLLPLDFAFLVLCAPVEAAQDMLDAGYRASRAFLRGVRTEF